MQQLSFVRPVAAVVAVASSPELAVESAWGLFLVVATVNLQNSVAAAVSAATSLGLYLYSLVLVVVATRKPKAIATTTSNSPIPCAVNQPDELDVVVADLKQMDHYLALRRKRGFQFSKNSHVGLAGCQLSMVKGDFV